MRVFTPDFLPRVLDALAVCVRLGNHMQNKQNIKKGINPPPPPEFGSKQGSRPKGKTRMRFRHLAAFPMIYVVRGSFSPATAVSSVVFVSSFCIDFV